MAAGCIFFDIHVTFLFDNVIEIVIFKFIEHNL